jgi:alkaline phosphatase
MAAAARPLRRPGGAGPARRGDTMWTPPYALVLLGVWVACAQAQGHRAADRASSRRRGDISDGSYSGGATEIARRAQEALDQQQRAKNVILFIGDGNGISTNFATRLYAGQQEGLYGDEYVLPHETMPALAMVKTYNSNAQTPDSAGTATALHSGLKTKSGVLGLGEAARKGFCEDVPDNIVASIAEHAKRLGKKVGIVSTARMTHATPGAVYAHSADRDWEAAVPEGCTGQDDIATQLFDAMVPSDGEPVVDVSLGGGRRGFFPRGVVGPEGDEGDRTDGIDLIERFKATGGAYAWNLPTFELLPLDGQDPILGLFESSHMSYEFDRVNGSLSEPSIMEMTAAAVQALEARDTADLGYFLMVESGRIDHANHAGNLFRVVTEGVAFQEAVAYALENTDPTETLVISTADHSHGLEFNGYCGRGSPIMGMCYKLE